MKPQFLRVIGGPLLPLLVLMRFGVVRLNTVSVGSTTYEAPLLPEQPEPAHCTVTDVSGGATAEREVDDGKEEINPAWIRMVVRAEEIFIVADLRKSI